MKVVKKIGQVKKKYNIPVLQKKRWKDVIATRVKGAQKKGLDGKFVSRFLKTIHDEAVKIQKSIVKKGPRS
jgi:chorismate mutase